MRNGSLLVECTFGKLRKQPSIGGIHWRPSRMRCLMICLQEKHYITLKMKTIEDHQGWDVCRRNIPQWNITKISCLLYLAYQLYFLSVYIAPFNISRGGMILHVLCPHKSSDKVPPEENPGTTNILSLPFSHI